MRSRSPYRDDFFKEIRRTRIFPNYDLYHDFLDLLNRTVEDHSVIQLCKGARINPRRIYFASDFKKKPKKKEEEKVQTESPTSGQQVSVTAAATTNKNE